MKYGQVQEIISAVDADGEGLVDYTEFIATCVDVNKLRKDSI